MSKRPGRPDRERSPTGCCPPRWRLKRQLAGQLRQLGRGGGPYTPLSAGLLRSLALALIGSPRRARAMRTVGVAAHTPRPSALRPALSAHSRFSLVRGTAAVRVTTVTAHSCTPSTIAETTKERAAQEHVPSDGPPEGRPILRARFDHKTRASVSRLGARACQPSATGGSSVGRAGDF